MKRMVRTKLLLLLAMMVGLSANVFGQPPHAYYSDVVLSTKGTPVPGASVLVYESGTKIKGKLFKGESAGTTKFASFLDLTSATHDVSSTGWNLSGQQAFDDKPSTRWSSAAGVLPPFALTLQQPPMDLGRLRSGRPVAIRLGRLPEFRRS